MMKSKYITRNLVALGVLALSATPTFAQVDLNLEELMALNTSVSDKIDQPVMDAPGFISVYSQDEIQRYGTYSIEQLVGRTPGYSTVHNFGEPGLMTRGVTGGGWNNNSHLMLIDGIPFRMVRSNKAYINHAIPLHFVQQVEMLRGPASALYGVGAYAGVIQITPKSSPLGESEQFFRGGFQTNLDAKFVQSYSTHSGEFGHTTIAYGAYSKDANASHLREPTENLRKKGEEPGEPFARQYWDQEDSKFFFASHSFNQGWLQNLKGGLIYAQSEGGIGEYWGSANYQPNSVLWETYSPYLKYELNLPMNITNYSYVAFNRSKESGRFFGSTFDEGLQEVTSSSFNSYVAPVEAWDVSNEFHFDLDEGSKIIAGFNYYQVQAQGHENGAEGWTVDTVISRNKNLYKQDDIARTVSGYLQATSKVDILSGLLLTAGARFDNGTYGSNEYQQLSPRLSVVQKLTPHLNLKALYGTALKSPGTKEVGLNQEANQALVNEMDKINARPGYNPKVEELSAETITTSEFGVAVHQGILDFSANLFHTETENPIIQYNLHQNQPGAAARDTLLANDPSNPGLYTELEAVNANKNGAGRFITMGLEIEANVKIDSVKIFSNYTYTTVDTTSTFSSKNIPEHQIKAGVSYTTETSYPTQIAAWGDYTSSLVSMHDKKRWFRDTYSFSQMNLNIRQAIYPTTWVEVKITNILDEVDPIVQYSYNGSSDKLEEGISLPRDGREISIALTSTF